MFNERTKEFEPLEIFMIKNLMSSLNLKSISLTLERSLPWIKKMNLYDSQLAKSYKIIVNEDKVSNILF